LQAIFFFSVTAGQNLCCENGHPNFGWSNFGLVMNQMEATC